MSLVSVRPAPLAPRPWSFPAFERVGRTIACHVPGKPLAVATIVIDGGVAMEPAGLQGIATLLASAMTEGTERLDAFDFALATERLGAEISVSAGWDAITATADAPVEALPAAVALLADVVRRPRLSPETLDRVRRERLDELAIEASQPATLASQELSRQLYAPASRFAHPAGGDVDGVASSSDDAIRRFFAERVAPELATLVVVGDLEEIDVPQLSATVFDGWSATTTGALPVDVTTRDEGRRIVLVDRPGSVQSVLAVGHVGPARDIEDYVAATTMAMVLGGMFSSRLNLKLREEKGYTYGAGGGFDMKRHAGSFAARTAVQTDVTAPALLDLVSEIERTATSGVTDTERDDAVAYRSGVFPINFAGVHPVAHGLAELVVHGWEPDHYDRLRAEVMAVTAPELTAAAGHRLRPADLVMVVVGDAASVEESLRDTGLGPVTVVSLDG